MPHPRGTVWIREAQAEGSEGEDGRETERRGWDGKGYRAYGGGWRSRAGKMGALVRGTGEEKHVRAKPGTQTWGSGKKKKRQRYEKAKKSHR